MKAWLKGALAGLVVLIILFLIFVINSKCVLLPMMPSVERCSFLYKPAMALLSIFGSITYIAKLINIESGVSIVLLFSFIYFFIGAIIGWIVGKRKSKKQQPIQTQPQVQSK